MLKNELDKMFLGAPAPDGIEITTRRSIRCVARNNNKFLLVHYSNGNYEFPGGGVEIGETDENAVIREVLEETGFKVSAVGNALFTVVRSHIDYKDPAKFYIAESIYIECEIDISVSCVQSLEDYELEQQLEPVFISLDEAIYKNEKVVEGNPWVLKENLLALKKIYEIYNPGKLS